jgi:membrane peptidoglycan carboxypeptidase
MPTPAEGAPSRLPTFRRPTRREVLRGLLVAGALGLLALVLGAGVLWVTTDLPADEARNPQASVIQYADGSELAQVGTENRTSVSLDQVSEAAEFAVLAAEDRQFYSTTGISLTGIVRAAWENLRSGEIEQGGSTITQQYVRNAFLSQERSWMRKLREAVLAIKLDSTEGKQEILSDYLNTVYFGRGAYGIEAASQTFFGKPAAELTAAEGAVLAAMLASPSGYDPATHPEAARARWRYVLEGMAEQGWLDRPVSSYTYPAVKPRDRSNTLGGPTGYLVAHVEKELAAHGISESLLNTGGLVVRTTIDREAQDAAVKAVETVTGETVPPGVYRALVSVEPGTGRIRAEYGGHDYVTRQFNSVTDGTAQAGSSFKPFVLATALEEGISLRSRYDGSSPQTFREDYEVRNYGDADYGRISLLKATENSVNTVYVDLGLETGPRDIAETARELGISTEIDPARAGASIALGVTAVRPLDQAAAYATLAARGVRAEPFIVEKVTDRYGEVLYQAEVAPERALPAPVADDVNFALQQVVADGTGQAAALPGRPVAGKTGTTTGNTAAWFVGYTPLLSTAVALYSEREDTPLRNVAGVQEVTGGTLPARIWQRYMANVLEGEPVAEFAPPPFLEEDVAPSPDEEPDRERRTRAPEPEERSPSPSPPSPSPSPSSASPSPSPSPSTRSPSPEPSESDLDLPPPVEPSESPSPEPEPTQTSESPEPEPTSSPEPTTAPETSEPKPTTEASPEPSASPVG